MRTTILTVNELPPTLNEIIGTARRHKFASAQLKKLWNKKLAKFVSGLDKFRGRVYLECVWRVKNKRRDPDNIAAALKFPLDALVNARIIKDDNLKVIQSPVIHHVVVSEEDGFSLYLRDKEAFKKRLKENIMLPPRILIKNVALLANPVSDIPSKSRVLRNK